MANYNKITYKGRTITDEDLAIGGGLTNNMMLYQALISEELRPDTFVFNLIYDKNKVLALIDADGKYLVDSQGRYLLVRADEFDPEDMTFGDPLNYYINNGGTLMGKWYVRTVRRVQKKVYRFECMSAIGLLAYKGHNGGIYKEATVGDLISDIMGDIPYEIYSDLSRTTVTGWLPKVSAARDNLQAVLFMAGASIKYLSNGRPYFVFLSGGNPRPIDNVYLNVGGTISQLEPATRVEVTAHEYIALSTTEDKVLFDNAESQVAVVNQTIVFDGPYHSLNGNGLIISEQGDNYAVITGIGTLTGKPYVHSTIVYGMDTGVKSQANVITVENNHLITIQNVANVARRIANYYSIAKEVSYTMRLWGVPVKPGDEISFTDPFGEPQTGHVKAMNVTLSHRLNAQATIALNWTPGPFGDAYNLASGYDKDNVVNGRLTLDNTMIGSPALVMLFSGAGGGQAGFDGEDGQAPHSLDDYYNKTIGLGGKGGKGGAPGERGRVYSFFVDSLPAYFDNVVIGTGGEGGASNGELGQPGTDTSIGSHSTANGTQLQEELTGNFYYKIGFLGDEGYDGKDGGIGSGRDPDTPDLSTDGGSFERDRARKDPRTGEYITEHIVEYAGGVHSNPHEYRRSGNRRLSGGAGGGGAGYGNDGQDGWSSEDSWNSKGGDGGDGGLVGTVYRTWTGNGGHGGGGGGGAFCGYSKGAQQTGFSYGGNQGGKGGKGGPGGKGGDGYILILYHNQA